MANEITVDLTEWNKFATVLDRDTVRLLDKHMHNAMDGSLALLVDWISAETPVNFGLLRASFGQSVEVHGTPFDMTGLVGTSLIYGLPVEMGRKAGSMPPVDAIKLWAVRKLGLKGKAADQAAWAIAIHLRDNPTKGAFMVQQAFDQAVSGPELESVWADELEKFLKDLAK